MWFILSLLAGLLFAVNRLIVRSSLTKKVNLFAFGAIHEVLAGVILLPVAFLQLSFPKSNETFIALILSVIFIFLADLFAFLSLTHIEATLYQIIGQLRHIIVLIGAYILFTEAITLIKIISIFLIILGVYIALSVKSKVKITRSVIYALFSTICIGLGFLFIKEATVDVAPAVSASLSLIVSGILIYLIMYGTKKHRSELNLKGNRKNLIIAAVTFALFEFTLFTALSSGQASLVTPVTQSSMIFTLIGGYMYLQEKNNLSKKIIGGVLILAGIIMLYFI